MGKLSKDGERVLPEFQSYLMERTLAPEVQDLLGHKHVETTMVYTHVLRNMSNAPKSPLDQLYETS